MTDKTPREVRIAAAPGKLTFTNAARAGEAFVEALNIAADDAAAADGIAPGSVRFGVTKIEWIDDGKDDLIVRFEEPA